MTNSLTTTIHLLLITAILIRCHRVSSSTISATNRSYRSTNPLPPTSNDDQKTLLDRNMAIACTNRYNCERICSKAKAAKQASKASLIDTLTSNIGESTLTDAHKLGIQFGRHKSCEKCSLIYSNCIDELYRIARRQLFNWRNADDDQLARTIDHLDIDRISSHKSSSNRL